MTTQYWITGLSGDWSDAADWVSGAVPGSADGAVITSSGNIGYSHVTVTGTAAAYSLTLDYYSTLTVSGALTLGTSLTVDDSATLTLSGRQRAFDVDLAVAMSRRPRPPRHGSRGIGAPGRRFARDRTLTPKTNEV